MFFFYPLTTDAQCFPCMTIYRRLHDKIQTIVLILSVSAIFTCSHRNRAFDSK